MAALPELSGPPQTGRGVKGQYVYWVTMSHPRPETVEADAYPYQILPAALHNTRRAQQRGEALWRVRRPLVPGR